jgi:hypothetical protein
MGDFSLDKQKNPTYTFTHMLDLCMKYFDVNIREAIV